MKLSKSRLQKYITCPQSYLLQYELKVEPLRSSSDLLTGLSTHKLITSYFAKKKKGETCNLSQVLEEFWSGYPLENTDFETQEDLEAAKRESRKYAELFLKEVMIEPLEIEYEFTLPLLNLETGDTLPGVELTGIIDLIDCPNGKSRALEIKTRSRKQDDFQAKTSLELTCYAYWLKFLDDTEEVPVSYINIVKNKRPYIQWKNQKRGTREFVELFHTAKVVSENIRDKRFYKNPGVHCNWCDYYPVCSQEKEKVVDLFGKEGYERLREGGIVS